ncbi:hypothetical protein JI735_34225 (plasmid) [Paenibacillus sonchi]|uniref:Uncharacterized protein n=1 Tax=Paenibacillus sonchi TaxID=373687 RepID=A0A974PIA7_9BACL|nr:hypothetical protein [Paenibacillus sonchi]QQZ64499.1 hypothetical protein JI735_34225 [Paenibacillus sonchi]
MEYGFHSSIATTHIRIEKIMKDLTELFKKRQDNFEDLKFFAIEGKKEDVKFCSGKGEGYRRCIYDLLISFGLTDTELYKENDERFELLYLKERERDLQS